MITVTACALLAAAGLLLLIAEITGRRHRGARAPHRAGFSFSRRGAVRPAVITCAAVLAWVITGWPVAGLAVAVAAGLGPTVLSAKPARRRIERLEALELWCRQLADTLAGSAGLEQAVRVSAAEAPLPVRQEVQTLARRFDTGVRPEEALRDFATAIGDPVGDMIAAALILAVQAHGAGLAEMLTRLARTVARDVAAQREIDAERAGSRTTARWVAVFLAAYTGFALLNRAYTAPFGTPAGQVMLALVVLLYALALWWLHRLAAPPSKTLFLNTRRPR